MKRTKRYIQMIQLNMKTLLVFEVLYKLFGYYIFIPFTKKIFNWVVRIQGYSYISTENMKDVVLQPLSIGAIILILGLIAYYFFVDASAVIYLLDQAYQKKKTDIKRTFAFSAQNSLRIFKWKNLGMIPMILFMIPFLNFGIAVSYYQSISIPSPIQDVLLRHKGLILLIIVGLIVLCIYMVRWMYSIHFFTIERKTFQGAKRKSVALAHNARIIDFVILLIVQLIYYISFELFTKLGIFIIVSLINSFSKYWILSVTAMSAVWMVIGFLLAVYIALATPVGYVMIGLLYYYHVYKKI